MIHLQGKEVQSLIEDDQEDRMCFKIINWWSRVSRMTNEMMVRRAKSAKIGKTLTAYLILSADGGGWGVGVAHCESNFVDAQNHSLFTFC